MCFILERNVLRTCDGAAARERGVAARVGKCSTRAELEEQDSSIMVVLRNLDARKLFFWSTLWMSK